MHANRESHDIKNDEHIAIRLWRVGVIHPFQNEPDHNGRKKHRTGIDFRFDRVEPLAIRKRKRQRPDNAGGIHRNAIRLRPGLWLAFPNHQESHNDQIRQHRRNAADDR